MHPTNDQDNVEHTDEKLSEHHNVQALEIRNKTVGENPTGGSVHGKGVNIFWQNGPRGVVPGKEDTGELEPGNGAFVEDVIYAAKQRLEFFQQSKYKTDENATAIEHLTKALDALKTRRDNRAKRNVEGKHEV